MFDVLWDKRNNGILLKKSGDERERVVPPRPVFHEELDLLGFDRYWSYPPSENPLLWAVGRRYFYEGTEVAQAKGGNIYEAPELILTEAGKTLGCLVPIDIEGVVERNLEALYILENEALDFIEHTYKSFKGKTDFFAVAYSGGKDSEVVLDLVTRIIPPDELIVVFSDTTMEISYTYDAVERAKKKYEARYPGLRFFVTKPPKPAIEFWDDFGPPSRIHRWCCTVTKTAPFTRLMKSLLFEMRGELRQPKVVVFEGVRAEESSARSKYKRITKQVKGVSQVNAESLMDWNLNEVFMYLFYRSCTINKGYRYGLNRVGCSICPFSSKWSEFILLKKQEKSVTRFIEKIKMYGKNLKIDAPDSLKSFIAKGSWKTRSGGRGIDNGTDVKFLYKTSSFSTVLKKPRSDVLEWMKILGKSFYKYSNSDHILNGEIKVNETGIVNFSIKKEDNNIFIDFDGLNSNLLIGSMVKKIIYKATFCVRCGACQALCPTDAIDMSTELQVKENLCIHCGSCIKYFEKGCLVAKSLNVTTGGGTNMESKPKKYATSKYQTFGLRKEWLSEFIKNPYTWFENNNLGNRQVDAFIAWLKDAELLDSKKTPTVLVDLLKSIFLRNEIFVWEIIIINLYHEAKLIEWYLDYVEWGEKLSSSELIEKLLFSEGSTSRRTAQNSITTLINLFKTSPLGDRLLIGSVEEVKRQRFIKKLGTNRIEPFSIAYSLYRLSENLDRRDFTTSELYDPNIPGGPYKIFGVSRETLEEILRGLQEDRERILRVDLAADLDNIYLRDDLTPLDIVKIAAERM